VEELLKLLVLGRVVPTGALERCRSHVGWLLLDRVGDCSGCSLAIGAIRNFVGIRMSSSGEIRLLLLLSRDAQ
jgi:hypothetical protein